MLHRKHLAAKDVASELEQWQEQIDIIRHKLKFIRQLPLVACVTGFKPLETAGDRIPALVELAGGVAITAEDGKLPASPEIVLMMLPGMDIGENLARIGDLLEQAWFAESPACRNNRVYLVNSRDYFQPGPGMIDSIEILAEVINTGDFYFGFEGKAWLRFEQ